MSTHLQATLASEKDQKSSQIVPHVPLYMTSTRPMCSPYVPLTNRISSISVPFPNGLGNWPAEERKLIQVSMMLKIIFFFLPCSQFTPNFIVTCFSGVQQTLSHFVRGAFLYRRGIGVTRSGHCDSAATICVHLGVRNGLVIHGEAVGVVGVRWLRGSLVSSLFFARGGWARD